jgi:Rps23 Pro-64 3,4-dihydroxylase Tpa1-like proline 4-hydroxylase
MTPEDIKINPSLDLEALAAQYAAERFVQIPNFFADETAMAIETVLRQQTPWNLIYADPDSGIEQISRERAQQLGQAEMQRRMSLVMQRATRNYGYCYNGYQMSHARRDGKDPGHPLHAITDFLNSPAYLDLGAKIIGETGIIGVDAQATLFNSGSFLTRHIDEGSQNERRAAYTLSFCRNWQTDWGGQLQFIDQQTTDVTSAWVPRWNTLTLFDGRRVHAVSPVSAFAGDGRYSIVGWLRDA